MTSEQYLTLKVPAIFIDSRDLADGGTFVYDAESSITTPVEVRAAEARLADQMVPLAAVTV